MHDRNRLLDGIQVDPEVLRLRPDFALLAIVVEGLPSGPSEGTPVARRAEAGAHVDAWREAYRAFGAKPNRTRNSLEALLRRPELPQVNRVVDIYNRVSVRHGLPIGGEDLDAYAGLPRLVRARGDEAFDTMANGEPVTETADPGEVVWRDDAGVTCRRWNHRQCVRTRLREDSKRGLFLLERLEPMPLAALSAAGEDLIRALGPDVEVCSRLIAQEAA
ncbi:phenylalanine--tRNA ligase beta subunit-related protein [Amycolatopsis cynarae]|uniref:Phenylalanine--tRNA ligase beta subunit-related protein n=1 Tax=Amycolatopsis cynarae TaxID=2995223 RepID=A0ABY7AZU6_9PSEU|nr:phenylalanine--tRNA ligase beta subunit-related protein [Amycolatopsis sp. HUAS 11-8]WAL65552.1 phenylalanine--tRNA ligase beta subunit-related protein [Amycolatopsis sp. HUAS 11-8]